MIRFLSIFLAFNLLVSANAFASPSKSKSMPKKYIPVKNVKPTSTKMTIVESQEIKKIFEGGSSGDGHSWYGWEDLHMQFNLKFSDDSQALITAVRNVNWENSSGRKGGMSQQDLEELMLFEFQEGDEIQFNSDAENFGHFWEWTPKYGNYLEFTLYRDGDPLGEFKGYYLIPGANTDWDWLL